MAAAWLSWLWLVLSGWGAAAGVVYVDAAAGADGDGATWAGALPTIRQAIYTAVLRGDGEVWVARGTYAESVRLADGVALYGGFAGSETQRDQRRPDVLLSIIDASHAGTSGGGGGDDRGGGASREVVAGPAEHAVVIDGVRQARLDGFVVTGGAAVGGWGDHTVGGGLFVRDATDVQVAGCTITGNSSVQPGGGVFCGTAGEDGTDGRTVTFSRCRIIGNSGGAVACEGSSPRFENCLLAGHVAAAGAYGVVFYVEDASPTVVNVTVAGNDGTGAAGALVDCQWQAAPVFVNTLFADNLGVLVREWSDEGDPVLDSCLVYGQDSGGAGDYVDYEVGPLTGVAALNRWLGGARVLGGDPRFGVAAVGAWGEAPVYDAATNRTTLTAAGANWTADALAGRVLRPDSGQCRLAVVVGNTATTVTVCGDLQGGAQAAGAFEFPDYHLQDGSAAIDRADPARAPVDDLDGEVRAASDATPDIGADEAPGAFAGVADLTPPVSWVEPLPAATRSAAFDIPFGAVDAEGTVALVRLYYRRSGGGWTLGGEAVPGAPLHFDSATTGGDGQYEFHTLASDTAGNIEPVPAAPYVAIRVLSLVPDGRLYVVAGGAGAAGTGSSWAEALADLQVAADVAAAAGIPEVWVAAGVYRTSLVMPGHVALYGGFAGGEGSLAERSVRGHPAIIDAWRAPRRGAAGEYRAVTLQSITAARLDGFHVTGGLAYGEAYGGGLFFAGVDASVVVANCVISGNEAYYGGGVFCNGDAAPVLANCVIAGNYASVTGGAAYLSYASQPRLLYCTIDSNWAEQGPASGVRSVWAAPTLTNCIISNHSDYGLYVDGNSPDSRPQAVVSCLFSGNLTASGWLLVGSSYRAVTTDELNLLLPGAWGNRDGDPRYGVDFSGTWTSAPVWDEATHTAVLTDANALFPPADALAGWLARPDTERPSGNFVLTNTGTSLGVVSDWSGYSAVGDAYAVTRLRLTDGSAALDRAVAVVDVTTDIDGEARPGADGLTDIGADEADPAWAPPVVADAVAPQSSVRALPQAVAGAVVQVAVAASDGGSGVGSFRLFFRLNEGAWTAYGGDYTASPVRFDAGTVGGEGRYEFYSVATDVAGNQEAPPETADAATLILAAFSGRLYADAAAVGTGTGTSWANAFTTVGAALARAPTVGAAEVWVAQGVYRENLALANGLRLYGGFDGHETALAERDVLAHATVLTAAAASHVVTVSGANCRLDGFTVTGGRAPGACPEVVGGGIYGTWGTDGGLVVANCQIVANSAQCGAGLYSAGAGVVVEHCVLQDNAAYYYYGGNGGGLFLGGDAPVVRDCVLVGNSASGAWGGRGAAIDCDADSAVVTNCLMVANSAYLGSAIRAYSGPGALVNCVLARNSGGVDGQGAGWVIRNTVFAGNSGYAVKEDWLFTPQLRHCLFDGNATGDYALFSRTGGAPEVLTGAAVLNLRLPGAVANLGSDPGFVVGPAGTWPADTGADATGRQRSVFVDETASFPAGGLAGRLLIANTGSGSPAWIVANTATTITVLGNISAAAGAAYVVLDYHLQDGSPALDRGEVAGAPGADLDGNVRPGADGLVDIGVYEAPAEFAPVADAVPPTSWVQALPAAAGRVQVPIPFVATDGETGVAGVELWYSRDEGAWTRYGGLFPAGPIVFDTAAVGGDGRYAFYTVAVDTAGNREAVPATADAAVRVLTGLSGPRIYVDAAATGPETGGDWGSALHSVATAALLASDAGVPEVWVAQGVYREVVTVPASTALYGGFVSGATSLAERAPLANLTILDGHGQAAGELVRVDGVTNTLIDGFVIMRSPDYGILYRHADATNRVANCLITGNNGSYYTWGAIYCTEADPVIAGCWIVGNLNFGVYAEPGAPTLSNCLVAGNYSDGIYADYAGTAGRLTVGNCTIADNQYAGLSVYRPGLLCLNTVFADQGDYGVIYDPDTEAPPSAPWLVSCLFHANDDADCRFVHDRYTGAATINAQVGGAFGNLDGDPLFRVGPTGTWTAGAAVDADAGRTVLTDTMAVFTPGELAGKWLQAVNYRAQHLLILGNTETTMTVLGTFDSVPRSGDSYRVVDYQLRRGSPGIDTGYPQGPAADLGGRARPIDIWHVGRDGTGTEYDVGAYEYESEGGGDLIVEPADAFVTVGPPGGPFSPAGVDWTLRNGSGAPLDWVASCDAAWLHLASTSGTLAPGVAATVRLAVDTAAADVLPAGLHSGTLRFQDTSGGVQARSVSLRIGTDSFTEVFEGAGVDIQNRTLVFTPDGSAAGYRAERQPASWWWPTDPDGGTVLTFAGGNQEWIYLGEEKTVPFYGTPYSVLTVGAEGVVVFGWTYVGHPQSLLSEHFARPEVAGLYADLDPRAGGVVSWKQLPDRVTVTFDGVPSAGTSDPNRFQIDLFFDGTIRTTNRWASATPALVGLSRGTGVPADYYGSDMSDYLPRRGTLAFLWSHWRDGDSVEVEMADRDRIGAGAATVQVWSPAGDLEDLVLAEAPPWSGVFVGSVRLAVGGPATAGDGVLQAGEGEVLEARYADADVGTGEPGEAVATATVDDVPPVVQGVATVDIGVTEATVTVATDEPTWVTVRYGTAPGDLSLAQTGLWLSRSHRVRLPGLSRFTRFYYEVVAEDRAGNQTRADNGGTGYSFSTRGWPNLVPTDLTPPVQGAPGVRVPVGWTVANRGQDAIAAAWSDAVYLSADDHAGNDIFVDYLRVSADLAANGDVGFSREVVLPSVPSGSYWLVLEVDAWNEIAETNESDNTVVAGPFAVQNANLVLGQPGALPERVGTGETLGLSWPVTSAGQVGVAAGWYDDVFLSADDQPSGDDGFLVRVEHPQGLGLGETLEVTVAATVPASLAAGTYWLVIQVDAGGQITETDETDNQAILGPLTIGRPNLALTSVAAPGQTLTRRDITVSWEVGNTGSTGAVPDWTDTVYLSADPEIDAGDVVLGSLVHGGGLGAGSSYRPELALTVPEVPPGDYWVLVQADALGNLIEEREDDNTGGDGALTVSLSPCPDLVVSRVTVTAQTFSDQGIEVRWDLLNQGNEATVGPWTDAVFLSTDALPSGDDVRLGTFRFDGVLAPGGGATRVQNVHVPFELAGPYWAIVVTDHGNALFEREGEANNATPSTGTVTVTRLPLPNLQAFGVDCDPRTGELGVTSLRVSWNVRNVGTGPTSAPLGWTDSIYLSADPDLDGTDVRIGQARSPSYLDVGDVYGSRADVVPWGVPEGQYYVLVYTDWGERSEVDERPFEGDNVAIGPRVQINLPPPPDLVVESVHVTTPTFSRDLLQVVYHAHNAGAGAIRPLTYWQDEIWLSADAVLDAGDRRLGSFSRHFGGVGSSGTPEGGVDYTRTEHLALPVDLHGEFSVFVRVDAGNAIAEQAYEDNNVSAATPVTVVLTPPPDLEVGALVPPAAPVVSGQRLTLPYRVTNRGSTSTPSGVNWEDAVYLSTDDVFEAGTDVLLGTVEVRGPLAVDQGFSRTFVGTLPADLPSGAYHLFVVADPGSRVFELDKTNNLVSVPLTVEYRPADLVVEDLAADAAVEAGHSLYVRWSVANTGVGPTSATSWYESVYVSTDAVAGGGDDVLLATVTVLGGLAAGERHGYALTVGIPFTLAGDAWLYVVTDTRSGVYETSEQNNVSDLWPVAISRDLPDLAVSEASMLPESGWLRVEWSVDNVGANSTDVSRWYDAVYLTSDPVLDPLTATRLGVAYRAGPLPVGGTYTAGLRLDLQAVPTGTYRLFVVADANHEVHEYGAVANNIRVVGALVPVADPNVPAIVGFDQLRTDVNLVVAGVQAPATALSGQDLQVSWTVRNLGTAMLTDVPLPPEYAAGAWVDRVYLSRDAFFDPDVDVFLAESTVRVADWGEAPADSGATQQYTRARACRVPSGLSGPFHVLVLTDRTNRVTEYGCEGDNTAATAVATQVGLPVPADVTVAGLTVPSTLELGVPYRIEYVLANATEDPFAGAWWDRLYLSVDRLFSPDDVRLCEAWHGSGLVPAEGESGFVFTGTPSDAMLGTYYLVLRADVRNSVSETDEANNVLVADQTLTLGAPRLDTAYPDGLAAVAVEVGPDEYRDAVFRFEVADGETVTVAPVANGEVGWGACSIDAWAARGRVPFATAEADASQAGIDVQPLVLGSLPAGTWYLYVRVHGTVWAGPDPDPWWSSDAWPPAAVQARFAIEVTPARTVTSVGAQISVSGVDRWTREVRYLQFGALNAKAMRLRPVWQPVIGCYRRDGWYGNVEAPTFYTYYHPALADVHAVTRLAVSLDEVPTRFRADLAAEDWLVSEPAAGTPQPLTIPLAEPGTYIARFDIQGRDGPFGWSYQHWSWSYPDAGQPLGDFAGPGGSGHFMGSAATQTLVVLEPLPFTVTGVAPERAGNVGEVTFAVNASRFTPCTGLALVQDDTVVREPLWLRFADDDPSRVFATFDLRGVVPGQYQIRVTDRDGEAAAVGVEVVSGAGPAIHAALDGPPNVRLAQSYRFLVHYGNSGDTDAPAPLLVVQNLDGNPFALSRAELGDETVSAGAVLQVLGISRDGAAGCLRPGENRSLPVYFRTAQDSGNYLLRTVTADDPEPFDFATLAPQLRPGDVSDADWDDIRPRLEVLVGPTWGTYVRALGEAATYVSDRGERSGSVEVLFQTLVAFARYGRSPVLTGTVAAVAECAWAAGVDVRAVAADGSVADVAITDAHGRFELSHVPPGVYTVTADGLGFARWVAEGVDVTVASPPRLVIRLVPEAVLSGSLLRDDGPALAEATVVAQPVPPGLAPAYVAVTDEAGRFRLGGLPPGTFAVSAAGADCIAETRDGVVLAEAEQRDLGEWRLTRAATLAGSVVRDDDGAIPAGTSAALFQGGRLVTAVRAGLDGGYFFAQVAPGAYDLTVTGDLQAFRPEVVPLVLAAGEARTGVVVHLGAAATVSGTVRSPVAGVGPLVGIRVTLTSPSGQQLSATTDANGHYQFAVTETGDCRVTVPFGGAVADRGVTVADQAGAVVDLDVPAVAAVGGHVTLSDGTPVALAGVTVLDEAGRVVQAATTDEVGAYAVYLLQEARIGLAATAPGATFPRFETFAVVSGQAYTRDFVAGTASLQVTLPPEFLAVLAPAAAGGRQLADLLAREAALPAAALLWVSLLQGTEAVAAAPVGPDGTALLTDLAAGRYTVSLAGNVPYTAAEPVELAAGQHMVLDLNPARVPEVSGTVRLPDGSAPPVQTAVLFVTGSAPDTPAAGFTDATGRYRLTLSGPDRYRAVVLGPGLERTVSDELVIGGDLAVDLAARPATALLSGRLVDAEGAPVPVGAVALAETPSLIPCGYAEVKPDGTFVVEAVAGLDLQLTTVLPGAPPVVVTGLRAAVGTTAVGDTVCPITVLGPATRADVAPVAVRIVRAAYERSVSSWLNGITGWLTSFFGAPATMSPYHVTFNELYALLNCQQELTNRGVYWQFRALFDAADLARQFQDIAWLQYQGAAQAVAGMRAQWGASLVLLISKVVTFGISTYLSLAELPAAASAATTAMHLVQLTGGVQVSLLAMELVQQVSASLIAIGQYGAELQQKLAALDAAANSEDFCIRAQIMSNLITELLNFALTHVQLINTLVMARWGSLTWAGRLSIAASTGPYLLALEAVRFACFELADGIQGLATLWADIDYGKQNLEAKRPVYHDKAREARLAYIACRNFVAQYCSNAPGGGGPNPGGPVPPPGGPNPPVPTPPGGPPGGPGGPGGPNPGGPAPSPYNPNFVAATDPNDILGPAGVGDERWVGPRDALAYTIRFENVADATAPAQRVTITQQLDADLDWRTFRVDDFGWGDTYVELAGDQPVYRGQVELSASQGVLVDVTVILDVLTGEVTWILQAVDPETGDAPLDALSGFLPPNDDTGCGQGFVSYTVRPRSDAVSGATLDAQATIVFDVNEPIATPAIFNTVDAAPPTSQVDSASVAARGPGDLTVTWSGADPAGAGLAWYSVYVSDRGGAWQLWLERTELTSAVFAGSAGHSYAFYSLAGDLAGNCETAPDAPDVTARVPGLPPAAVDDAYLATEDRALQVGAAAGVLANDLDPEGASLTAALVTPPANGALELAADGAFVYTPGPDFSGQDPFSYRVTDGQDGEVTATVTLTVAAGADQPVAEDDDTELDEDSHDVGLDLLANDRHGDRLPLRLVSVGAAEHGLVRLTDAQVTYTPLPDYFGPDHFDYRICDERGQTATATVHLTVRNVNDPPVAHDDVLTVEQDSAANPLDATANDEDVDRDLLTVGTAGPALHGTVDVVGGQVRYTPTAGYYGPDRFPCLVVDGQGGEAPSEVQVTVIGRLELRLYPGWNLLSVPFDLLAPAIADLLNGQPVRTPAWRWAGDAYAAALQAEPLHAFWVYLDAAGRARPGPATVLARGLRTDTSARDVPAGWCLVGPVGPTTVVFSPGHVRAAWRWDAAAGLYRPLQNGDPLEPGQGYWLYLDRASTVQLGPAGP